MDYESARGPESEAESLNLIPEIAAAAAAAVRNGATPLLPNADNVVVLPQGASLDDIEVKGRDLVVELADGRTAYCTRLETPPTATGPPTEMHLVQRVKSYLLESFELRVRGPSHELTIEGILIGGLMNIERRIDGDFLDNQRARESLALVDVRSVLSDIIAARHFPEGPCFVLAFDGFEPVVDLWRMQPPGEDGRIEIAIADGWLVAGLDERCVPRFSIRRSGSAQTDAHVEAIEGEGVAPRPGRVHRPAEDAETPVEAAAGGERDDPDREE